MTRSIFMIQVGISGSVFVKTYDYFLSQGGFSQAWGIEWIPVQAESIEDARFKGCRLKGARPYDQQAIDKFRISP